MKVKHLLLRAFLLLAATNLNAAWAQNNNANVFTLPDKNIQVAYDVSVGTAPIVITFTLTNNISDALKSGEEFSFNLPLQPGFRYNTASLKYIKGVGAATDKNEIIVTDPFTTGEIISFQYVLDSNSNDQDVVTLLFRKK